MYRIQPILLASLLLAVGTASAKPVMTVDEIRQKQNVDFSQSSPDSEKNDAQTQIERMADHFDAFALQMPKVFNAKFMELLSKSDEIVKLFHGKDSPAKTGRG
ncbi:MAG: hypothetical protein WC856_11715 [Methylococcaceae bacterium]|jgi:hypothetical protein